MATNTNAFSACKVITNDDSGYVFNDQAELDMLAENSLVAIEGGSLRAVFRESGSCVTKVALKREGFNMYLSRVYRMYTLRAVLVSVC